MARVVQVMFSISRIAAPLGDVTMPTIARKLRQRTFARRSEQPFRLELAFQRLEFRLQQSRAARLHQIHSI